ncbi:MULTISPECIES: NUDIX domain-containing protein [Streptomyces]|uniref:NUDIX domain-containing protein n=1 Tax=Streptomyces sudanensis TaxID=436397 RepID=A0ABY4TJM5_9ACTN|nr:MULTISPECIES: NUDIX domain-containing protein [Streptomyces]URN18380.1 NUDIX domain-containing protein [Streptomyces sudanensis]
MVVRRSAGLLVFRISGGRSEVLLAHMGGPYWAARDAGAWTVPKGEYGPDETALAAARREFAEELGLPAPDGEPVPLGEARQAGGKVVAVWAVEGDLDPALVVPGTFTMEWPRGSGVARTFPEVDRVAWCTPREAAELLVAGQRVFVERLAEHLRRRGAA